MIEFQDAAKSYRIQPGPGRKAGAVEALRAVTLQLEPGSITGVVGPNGAGKTTLFGLLLGFLEPTAGDVAIDGLEPRAYVRQHGANYLPERFLLPRDWTIRSALHALLNLDAAAIDVDSLLADYELTQYAGSKAFTLSRGTMQRVGIAQAFARPRNLIVLDEPTEGLDPFWRVRFRERLRALRAPERSILIASHDLAEIERVADRVIVLRDGTIADRIELTADEQGARDYIITLAAPHDAVGDLFAGVRNVPPSGYLVNVQSAADLNGRLAALIEAGATVVSVNPAATLEQRVTGTSAPEQS